MTHYDILEVSEKASLEVIKMAYRTLAKKYHPDTFTGDASYSEEKMKRINLAYEILSDSVRRAKYDIFLREQRDQNTNNNNFYNSHTSQQTTSHSEQKTTCRQYKPPYAQNNTNSNTGYTREKHTGVVWEAAKSFFKSFLLVTFICVVFCAIAFITIDIYQDWKASQVPEVVLNAEPTIQKDNNNSTVGTDNQDITYNVCIRTIAFSDSFTAEYVLASWENGDKTEQSMIAIMDQYGSEQGGGQLYIIAPGEFVEEIDEWCFSEKRKPGDYAIIENAYGFSLCYFSSRTAVITYSPYSYIIPRSGDILSGSECLDGSELTITADSNNSYVVKLKTASGIERLSFYVRAGDTVTVGVPAEYLYVYFASGENWQGKKLLFGEDTYYSMDDEIMDFTQYSWEYILYPVHDGNFSETPIDPEDF